MHTYLLPGRPWQASGIFYDENGQSFPLTGRSQITRDDNEWTLDASMDVMFETPVQLCTTYSIHGTYTEHTLAWTSFNPALGRLSGTFSIIGSYIISVYSSEDGAYSGSETLIQVDENTYHNVGVAFRKGRRLSAWTVLLTSESDLASQP